MTINRTEMFGKIICLCEIFEEMPRSKCIAFLEIDNIVAINNVLVDIVAIT